MIDPKQDSASVNKSQMNGDEIGATATGEITVRSWNV